VIAEQEYSDLDERIVFYRKEDYDENPIEIPSGLFRRVNFIKYDSLRSPEEELTFYGGRGVSRFLGYLVQEFINQQQDTPERGYIVEDTVNSLIAHIDRVFGRLKPLKNHGIGLFTDAENPTDLLARILKLKGADGFDIQKSGCGVQFSVVVILSILERLIYLKQSTRWQSSIFTSKRASFTRREYEEFTGRFPCVMQGLEPFKKYEEDAVRIALDEMSEEQKAELGREVLDEISTRKNISLVLGLDEPEIHLHPYRQRSLIKYISSLLNNTDDDFSSLLKEIFGIDTIDGQAIIVSHSPNVLLDDYRHIVRLYRDDGIKAVSGGSLQMDAQMEKHLLMNFPYIKEAFFSRCVIVVEGETEFGALPLWAEKTIDDPDEFGITVIGARGAESVPPIVRLLNELKIPNVSVIDRDKFDVERHGDIDGLGVTAYRDFEEDLFEVVYAQDSRVGVLFDVLREFGTKGLDRYVDKDRLDRVAQKYGIENTWDTVVPQGRCKFTEVLGCSDKNLLKAMFLSWMTLSQVKTITFGRFLGGRIGKDLIPQVYRRALEEAKIKAECVDEGSDCKDS
jgi:putative ATP-dependent endonuclease of OLD family